MVLRAQIRLSEGRWRYNRINVRSRPNKYMENREFKSVSVLFDNVDVVLIIGEQGPFPNVITDIKPIFNDQAELLYVNIYFDDGDLIQFYRINAIHYGTLKQLSKGD